MTERYKPSRRYALRINPDSCAASVPEPGGGSGVHQCHRKKKVGDWCRQHDPVAEEERHQASVTQSIASTIARAAPMKRIEGLEAEIERLRALVEDAYYEGAEECRDSGEWCWDRSESAAALNPAHRIKFK